MRSSVRGRGGTSPSEAGVTGVAIEVVDYGGVCRLQPRTEGDPDEWQTQHRYMQVEAFSQIDAAQTDPILSIQTQAA